MPVYEYECKACDIVEEFSLSFTHDAPSCNICNEPMNRVYYAAPVHFKGSGFYSTGG